MVDEIDPDRVLFGSDFNSLGEAMLADLVSAIPIIGEVTDIIRVSNSDTQRKRLLQTLDTLTDPIPVLNLLTPTNTLIFLDKTKKIDLSPLDNLLKLAQLKMR